MRVLLDYVDYGDVSSHNTLLQALAKTVPAAGFAMVELLLKTIPRIVFDTQDQHLTDMEIMLRSALPDYDASQNHMYDARIDFRIVHMLREKLRFLRGDA